MAGKDGPAAQENTALPHSRPTAILCGRVSRLSVRAITASNAFMTSNSQSAGSIWSELARKPDASFPNRLLNPVGAVVLPARGALLAVLTLSCLAMQTWSASRWHIVWPDSVDYIRVSQALDRGDPQPMVLQFGLNVYPLILTALHRLGGDWEAAGQAWSLAMASLVVLPLFGWLRRQFDDATAAAGSRTLRHPPQVVDLRPAHHPRPNLLVPSDLDALPGVARSWS